MKTIALFVSIDNYPKASGISKLNCPNADADALAQVLSDYFGYKCRQLNDENCTKKSIKTALLSTTKKLQADDTFILYLTGHGAENISEEKGYFIPWDAKKDNSDTWLDFDEIIKVIKESKAWTTIIFADMCNAGYFLHKRLQDTGLVETRKFIYALSSGLAGEKVEEGNSGEHSPFAVSLLTALSGWGGIGEDEDPHTIKVIDLFSFVRREVANQSLGQMPIGGYLARDISSNMEFQFIPSKQRLRPGLIRLLFYEDDPILLTIGLGELLESLGLRMSTVMTSNSSDYLESIQFQSLDKRLQLLTAAKDRFSGTLLTPVSPRPPANVIHLGIEAIIRLARHTQKLYKGKYPFEEGDEEKANQLLNDIFLRSLAKILHAFDRVPGGREILESQENFWNQTSSALSGMVLAEAMPFMLFSDTDSWSQVLFKSVRAQLGLDPK